MTVNVDSLVSERLVSRRAAWGQSLALFALFFVLYFALGGVLARLDLLYDFFGADMWLELEPNAEYRHMLVPAFTEPLAIIIRRLTEVPALRTAALNAAFGALAVALSLQVFLRLVRANLPAFLLALLYGVSMSQLLFSSVPETYAIGAGGIVATHWLFLVSLERRRIALLPWFGVALWTIGITTSNIAQTAVAFAAAGRAATGKWQVRRGVMLTAAVFAAVVVLLPLQSRLLGTRPLLSVGALRAEYVDMVENIVPPPPDPEDDDEPDPPLSEARRPHLLATNYFLLAFVGGEPGRSAASERTKLEYFGYPVRLLPVGYAAAALWLVFWVAGLTANLRDASRRTRWPPPHFLSALGVIIVGNLILFTIYNPLEMYLYSLLIAFPILLAGINGELLRSRKWLALLGVLLVLVAFNNVEIITTMIDTTR